MEISPINFVQDKEACLNLRYVAEVASYGESSLKSRSKEYYDWLEPLIKANPTLCVHVHKDGKIIGQVEAQVNLPHGFVNLYSVLPEYRNLGVGTLLDQYIFERFKEMNVNNVIARVSKSNKQAIKFYLNNGWVISPDYDKKSELIRIAKSIK